MTKATRDRARTLHIWTLASAVAGCGGASASPATGEDAHAQIVVDAARDDRGDAGSVVSPRDAGGSKRDAVSPLDVAIVTDSAIPFDAARAIEAAVGNRDTGTSTPDAAIPTDPSGVAAARTSQLLDGIGINTHIDFPGYQTIGATAIETAIEYAGNGMLKILRDSPASDSDLTAWPLIAKATGVKFDAFIGEGAPSVYQDALTRMQAMVASGGDYLMGFEGGNEEDDSYPVSLGNSQQQAAAFQPMVWAAGQKAGLDVFQISFGAGWSSPTGDYGTVGNLSASASYGNAHTYPQTNPLGALKSLVADALLTTPGKPVAHSEWGWNSFSSGSNGGYGWCSEATCAAYDAMFIFDAFNAGNPYYFRYELFDDDQLESANSWGMFYDTGTPKKSATAMRVMFQLLGDPGAAAATFTPGKLEFTVTGLPAASGSTGGQKALFQKSDGSFWLALWNEQVLNNTASGNADVAVAAVPVTLSLTTAATTVTVYDVLAESTTPVASMSNVTTMTVSVPAHPVLVKIVRP